MQKLTIEQRIDSLEAHILSIKRMVGELLQKMEAAALSEDVNDSIMNVKQVASYLNLDANSIYTKCGKGEIPYFKIGKGYRFKKSEIEEWIEGHKEEPQIAVDDYVNKHMQKYMLKA